MHRQLFFDAVQEAQAKGASPDAVKEILGRGRAKLGMFEGNLDDGELEIGQVAAMIDDIKPASEIMKEIISEFTEIKRNFCSENLF